MKDAKISLLRFPGVEPLHNTLYFITHTQELFLGGREGRKLLLGFLNPHDSHSNDLRFVAKEYEMNEADKLFSILRAYNQSRKIHLPVPNTTRYFQHKNKYYLLMSDQSQNGKYKLWAYNSNVPNEDEIFADAHIQPQDVDDIMSQAAQITDCATNGNAHLKSWNFVVRYDNDTKTHDITLLDLIPDMFTHLYKADGLLAIANKESLNDFKYRIQKHFH